MVYIRDGTVPLAGNNQLLPFTSFSSDYYSKKKGEHFAKPGRKKRKTAFSSMYALQVAHLLLFMLVALYFHIYSMDFSLIMEHRKTRRFPQGTGW